MVQTEALLDEYISHHQRHGFSFWAVVERASGAVIGDAGLYTRGDGVELGCTLAYDCWHRGYGTQAARLCTDAAFGPVGLAELVAVVRPENRASAAVLLKLGFDLVGRTTAYGAEHALYRLQSTKSP